MRKINLWLLVFLLFTACMSSPEKQYFQLFLTPSEGMGPLHFDKVLLVETVGLDDLYDDYRIIYRLSEYEMNYYSYVYWADKPSTLVRDSVIHFFNDAGIFRKVIKEFSAGDPDWILKSRIHSMEEIDRGDSWYARLFMDMEIIDFKSGGVLATHQFDRTDKLAGKQVDLVPKVISRILSEEVARILEKLREPGPGG